MSTILRFNTKSMSMRDRAWAKWVIKLYRAGNSLYWNLDPDLKDYQKYRKKWFMAVEYPLRYRSRK